MKEPMNFARQDDGPQLRVGKEQVTFSEDEQVFISIRVHTGPRKALQVK